MSCEKYIIASALWKKYILERIHYLQNWRI